MDGVSGFYALIAVLPILAVMFFLVVLRWPAIRAMPVAYAMTLLFALWLWQVSPVHAIAASLRGGIIALSLLWIIFGAIVLLFTLQGKRSGGDDPAGVHGYLSRPSRTSDYRRMVVRLFYRRRLGIRYTRCRGRAAVAFVGVSRSRRRNDDAHHSEHVRQLRCGRNSDSGRDGRVIERARGRRRNRRSRHVVYGIHLSDRSFHSHPPRHRRDVDPADHRRHDDALLRSEQILPGRTGGVEVRLVCGTELHRSVLRRGPLARTGVPFPCRRPDRFGDCRDGGAKTSVHPRGSTLGLPFFRQVAVRVERRIQRGKRARNVMA